LVAGLFGCRFRKGFAFPYDSNQKALAVRVAQRGWAGEIVWALNVVLPVGGGTVPVPSPGVWPVKIFTEIAGTLKGSARRIFMAQVVKALGKGGRRRAEIELGWHRRTIRKGTHELESGFRCYDNFSARGRNPAEHHLPNRLNDITAIAEAESQTDPTFQTTRLYIRLCAVEVRKQLIKQKGYGEEALPCEDTIGTKLNQLGYHPKKVKKVSR